MTNEERALLVAHLMNRVAYYHIGDKQVRTGDELAEKAANQIEADGKRIAELEAALRRLYMIILENSPDEAIADNGMTVWDGLKNEARKALGQSVTTDPKQIAASLSERKSRIYAIADELVSIGNEAATVGGLKQAALRLRPHTEVVDQYGRRGVVQSEVDDGLQVHVRDEHGQRFCDPRILTVVRAALQEMEA